VKNSQKYFLAIGFSIFLLHSYAQSNSSILGEGVEVLIESAEDEKLPMLIVEVSAEYKGGKVELYESVHKFVAINLPKSLKKAGVKGKVYVSFIVEKNGSLSEVNVLKGLTEEADNIAIEAIKQTSGYWEAAKHGGKEVRQKLIYQVTINL